MRPNLSFERFAAVLATVGAGALAGCGGGSPPPAVQANEVAPAAAPSAAAGHASCSAASCGGTAAAAAPTAASPATSAAAATTPPVDATPAPASSATAAATPAASSSAAAPAPAAKPVAKKKKAATAPSGEASCGAGTCASNAKKILVSPRVRGVGLGLRWDFIGELLERTSAGERLPLDFLEVSPENYMKRGGAQPAALRELAGKYPIVTHGLTMSLGGSDPLDGAYLRELAATLRDLGTPWHSDHLCVGAIDGRAMHDLLPVSLKHAAVERVADRVRRARDALGLPLAIENVSYYWHPGRAELTEPEFLARVCERADCGLMLDVNNAYVNCVNFGVAPEVWLDAAPLDRVVQIHVAGHEWFAVDARGLGEPAAPGAPGAMIIDTHGAPVGDPVLAMLARVLERTGPVPIVLERDQNVPSLDDLLAEAARIRAIAKREFTGRGGGKGAEK